MVQCFADVACTKGDWAACGYAWLYVVPVGVLWFVWIGVGLAMLIRTGRRVQFDPGVVHDPLAQGIAIALAQRKSDTERRPRLLRYLKLCAMWAEWPLFTFTPLNIALKSTGNATPWSNMLLMLSATSEAVNLLIALVCDEARLMRFAYPITFDVFYTTIVATFLRLGTCPPGYDHIALPGGATCECLSRYGIYWAVGFAGFVSIYSSALYYKTYIEPLATTVDFRFQTSFQIIMVMALNPIVSMLVNAMDLQQSPTVAVVITIGLLVCASFLLFYTFRTQPCIGSGRIPNNIRVLSFSSAIYTSLCVLVLVPTQGSMWHLYYALIPLPLLWLSAWHINNRRALLYHIPDLSILELLKETSAQAVVVGAIAAFHVDVTRLPVRDYDALIIRLNALAKDSEPLCRIYAIRTLWFCHLENFRKSVRVVGEVAASAAVPDNWWRKDEANPERLFAAKATLFPSQRRLSLCSDRDVLKVLQSDASSMSSRRQGKRLSLSTNALSITPTVSYEPKELSKKASAVETPYHIVRILDKHWISKTEHPDEAALQFGLLYQYSLETLSQSRKLQDTIATFEVADFLLQWYKSRYLRLSKAVYLEVLCSLCATQDPKLVMDVTHSLYNASLDGVIPMDLWLHNTSFLNQFMLALGHASKSTVFKCADVLTMVLEAAVAHPNVNLYNLLVPTSMQKLQNAFWEWHAVYDVSDALERAYGLLRDLEERPVAIRSKLSSHNWHALSKFKHGVAQILTPSGSKAPTLNFDFTMTQFQLQGDLSPVPSSCLLMAYQEIRLMPFPVSIGEGAAAPAKALVSHTTKVKFRSKATTLVSNEVICEIKRRRALRSEFVDLVDQAYYVHTTTTFRLATGSSTTRRRGHRNSALVSISARLAQIYHKTEGIAIHDYIATALDPNLLTFFEEHIKPLMLVLWVAIGAGMLRHDRSTSKHFEFNAVKIHDPLAQGVAVAISQRRSYSTRRPRLQRHMKVIGMLAELPSLTFAPLTIAFKVASMENVVEELLLSLNFLNEAVNLSLAVICGVVIVVLRCHSVTSRRSEFLLDEFAYPVAFDLFYIPIVSTFLRIGTCPEIFEHLELPGGATCDCIDRFGIYWALGLGGFVLFFAGSLYFKIYIEPQSTMMDFRFQSGYQIIMVMARTVDPLIAMLVAGLDLHGQVHTAVAISTGYLLCMILLLVYSYKTQPCIGSGYIPNCIRALTFSSAIYSTLCVLVFLSSHDGHDDLYYMLIPLPVVWIAAWALNHRRASQFHIPDLSILELLRTSLPQAKTVSAIAALYVDAVKLHPRTPLCRVYAIRTLWFAHIEAFRKAKRVVGEQNDATAVPPKLWVKDRENPDRPSSALRRGSRRNSSFRLRDATKEKRIKVFRVEDVKAATAHLSSMLSLECIPPQDVPTPSSAHSSGWTSYLSRSRSATSRVVAATVPSSYHVVLIRDKNWISKGESSDAAVTHFQGLYQYSLEVLSQSRAAGDLVALYEAALFLLQWYKTRYLRLSNAAFIEVTAALIGAHDTKLVVDAVHSLYCACRADVLPAELWLKNTSAFHQLVFGLRQRSASTVAKCAHVVASVLAAAIDDKSVNLYILLSPAAIGTIHDAFWAWHASYRVSNILEKTCLHLHTLEMQHRKKIMCSRPLALSPPLSIAEKIKLKTTELRSNVKSFIARSKNSVGVSGDVTESAAPRTMGEKCASKSTLRFPTKTAATDQTESSFDLQTKPPLQRVRSKAAISQAVARSKTLQAAPRLPTGSRLTVFSFVPPEIIVEIDRRQMLREQFSNVLHRAAKLHQGNTEKAGPSLNDVIPNATRPTASAKLDLVLHKIATLYFEAQECAMVDYAATALDPNLRAFFITNIEPRLGALPRRHHCDRLDWSACGYDWLVEVAIGVIALLWIVLGVAMMNYDSSTTRHFELDVAKIHDPLAQGIAVALAQRKSATEERPWLLRKMKLLGMWAEWPAYTFAPLALAFKAAGIEDVVEALAMELSPVVDVFLSYCFRPQRRYVLMLVLTAVGLFGAVVLRQWGSHRGDICKLSSGTNWCVGRNVIHHFLCPLYLDVLYIPIVSTFLRLGTCPEGFYHIPLPGGAVCDCVDRFGVFAVVGLFGFVMIYMSSLYYKIYIEPLSTTMDFRFQTGYDIVMVMARTLDPILSMLIVSMHHNVAITKTMPTAVCLLLSMVALFVYSYKTQPCIGSGRTPNNIRALTFSSS
ncbi:hypothetical protein ACHHYP_01205, partial [Achlya hypogyna]